LSFRQGEISASYGWAGILVRISRGVRNQRHIPFYTLKKIKPGIET
jgi:hypothetical protein